MAIRPAGTTWQPPESVGLTGDELALYTLIYQRTVASQMHDAVYDKTVVSLQAGAATLGAQGRILRSAGHTQLLRDEDNREEDNQTLPALKVNETYPLTARPPEGKKTSAPGRYSEATLVQAMEKAGIGRPSTYAQTLNTLHIRGYTQATGRHLAVTATGLLVTTYLSRQVPEVMGRDFTATMESGLDDIAAGGVTRIEYLTRFWTQGLEPAIGRAKAEPPTLVLPHLNGVSLLSSREGPQLQRAGQRAFLPDSVILADLTEESVTQILEGKWKPGKTKSEAASQTTESKAPRRKTSSPRKPAQKRTTSTTGPKKPRRKSA